MNRLARSLLLSAVSLAAASCSVSWAEVPMRVKGADPITTSFFGINGVSFLHYRDTLDATRTAERRMELVQKIGASTDRTDFWWGIIEPQKGKWQWGTTDWLIDFYHKHGVEPFPILSYNAAWMKVSPTSEQDMRDYSDYVFHTVSRYKDRVHCWEIWNEPNIETFWKPEPDVGHYAQLLKAGYAAAKKADPNCIVVAPATSMTDVNFLLQLAQHGASECMDAVSFHPYSHSDGPDQMDLARQISNVRTVMQKCGRTKIPLWITEMGWEADHAKPEEVERQAAYMVQSYATAAAMGVDRLYWFNLQDWNENGKLVGWGMLSPDWKVKCSADAYRVLRDKLLGARFTGWAGGLGSARALCFNKGSQSLLVAWSDAFHGEPLKLPADARVSTLYGAPVSLPPDGRLQLTTAPLYIEYGKTKAFTGLLPSPPARENLLVNAGFEQMETTAPYGWNRGIFYGGADEGGFFAGEEKSGHNRFVGIRQSKDALWQSWPLPALPGERYRLSADIKLTSATGENYVQILYLGGPGWAWKGGPNSPPRKDATTGWTQVSVEGTVPQDADIIRVNLVSKANQGSVEFDNVKLTRLESSRSR